MLTQAKLDEKWKRKAEHHRKSAATLARRRKKWNTDRNKWHECPKDLADYSEVKKLPLIKI